MTWRFQIDDFFPSTHHEWSFFWKGRGPKDVWMISIVWCDMMMCEAPLMLNKNLSKHFPKWICIEINIYIQVYVYGEPPSGCQNKLKGASLSSLVGFWFGGSWSFFTSFLPCIFARRLGCSVPFWKPYHLTAGGVIYHPYTKRDSHEFFLIRKGDRVDLNPHWRTSQSDLKFFFALFPLTNFW